MKSTNRSVESNMNKTKALEYKFNKITKMCTVNSTNILLRENTNQNKYIFLIGVEKLIIVKISKSPNLFVNSKQFLAKSQQP